MDHVVYVKFETLNSSSYVLPCGFVLPRTQDVPKQLTGNCS